jgi:pyruvate dehydrogenase E1 component alpha subunit
MMPLNIIENFSISHLQILDEKGRVDTDLEPALSDAKLLKLHHAMALSRAVDSRMLNLQRQGRLGTLPLCRGQEASICAPILAIRQTDWFVGSYRELGARLMRGESLMNALLVFNGYEEGNLGVNDSRTLPVSIILASQLSHAVGLAYGSRFKGEKDTVALVYFGDGATSEGDFHEALNFAGVLNSPVIFLCQNNQFAISTPRDLQTRSKTIAQKAIAYGISGIQVDGNDPLAVYQAVREAVDRARKDQGPTLIEAVTYRMLMHTTADDPTRYRSEEETAEWEARDPLKRFQIYLTQKGIWDASRQREMEAQIKVGIDKIVKEFESKKTFKPDAPFDHVFGGSVDIIEDQRAEFLEEMGKEGDNG